MINVVNNEWLRMATKNLQNLVESFMTKQTVQYIRAELHTKCHQHIICKQHV